MALYKFRIIIIIIIIIIITWTRMVDFNALITWKRLIDICFFFDKVKSLGIYSCLHVYEIPKNDLVDDMSCSLRPSVTFPESRCALLPHRNAGRLHWGKAAWKHTTLWFPGGSSHYRCWSAIPVTTAMAQPPLFFPPSALRLLPLSPF